MLTVVLTVLKIIGIILLIILFIILLILFVPIRYALDAEIPRKDLSGGIDEHMKDGIIFHVRISWLLHLIRGSMCYPASTQFSVKILFFTVFPRRIKKKKKAVEKTIKNSVKKQNHLQKEKYEAEPGSDEELLLEPSPTKEKSENWEKYQPEMRSNAAINTPSQESESEEKENSKDKEQSVEKDKNQEKNKNKEQSETQSEENESEKRTIFDFGRKCKDIALHIWKFLKNQQSVLQKTWYTISRICDKISMIKETLESDIFQRAWKIASSQLIKVWKQLRPGVCDVTVLYGTGDPALTAQILGIYAMMYPFLPYGVSVNADFDNLVIGCTAHIRGRITLFRLLWCAAVIYFNKDIRKIYRRFRRIMKR